MRPAAAQPADGNGKAATAMGGTRFAGRVAVVTGGAGGIGGATIAELAAEGARVVCADRAAPAALPAGEVVFEQVDVTDPAQVAALVDGAVGRWGRIDYLVNNAGAGGLAEAPEQTDAEWRRIFAVNIDAIMFGCRAAIPPMREQGFGAIVNVASISGLLGDYGMGAYAASKGAVVNYTRSLAIDCARNGIRINAVCPGMVETAMTAPIPAKDRWFSAIPMGRSASPAEIGAVIAFLLSDAASFMTGSVVVADGGMTAHTGQPRSPNLRPLP